ncbi:hypothetical protein PENSPDRAFT_653130 [Peniophora sp. CONT]|nr:hypothetical protein PENSPDRAFT_653130 [Peniophora sp. CONT]
MSSDEGNAAGLSASKKPRRSNIACDRCRKRKARCDGKQPTTGKCTNCTYYDNECTFSVMTKRYPSGYVEALETKVRKFEALVQRLLPGRNFTEEVGFELTQDNWMSPGVCGAPEPPNQSVFFAESAASTAASSTAGSSALSIMSRSTPVPMSPMPDDEHSSDDDSKARLLKLQTLRTTLAAPRPGLLPSYLGKSSATGLFMKAFEMRAQLETDVKTSEGMPRAWPWWLTFFDNHANAQQPLRFPDQALMDELIEHYFTNINIFTPILHRPTFENDLRSYLHLRERNFGCVVLLVCALGSRFTDDRRVLVDGDETRQSAGSKWFIQTQIFNDATLLTTTWHLHVLQAACLATLYSSDVSSIHAWMLVGSGIRFAVDIGAHKRRAYGAKPALEDELYKRSFWTLVYFDRTLSANMGRPCSIQEEDFDLEMPLCCDDEFFTQEDPEQAAQQPSLLSYFVWSLKLSQIQGLALRTVYASTKARVHYDFQGEEWMSRTVAHLDSLLNSWADSVPDHLRWEPTRADDVFFSQSAQLHLQYRSVQIMIHRPFITSRGLKPLPALSLAICTNAARAIASLAGALQVRTPQRLGNLDVFMWTLGVSAIVLLIGIGNSRFSNVAIDRKRTMADVELLLSILRERKDRWPSAIRLLKLLEYFKPLGEAGDEERSATRRKRPYSEDFSADPQPYPDITSDPSALPSSHEPDSLSGIDWSALLGSASAGSPVVGGMDPVFDGPIPQSTGAVFGNVDFGALFGLGDTGSEVVRPWSPVQQGDSLDDLLAGTFSGSGESTGFGTAELLDMPFDLGINDWQRTQMAPSQQGMGQQDGRSTAEEPLQLV